MDKRNIVAGELSKRFVISDIESENWRDRLYATVLDFWITLIKKGDCRAIPDRFESIRISQPACEKQYFAKIFGSESASNDDKKVAVCEIIALYHLAKCAERLANFVLTGGDKIELKKIVDKYFDDARSACAYGRLVAMGSLAHSMTTAAGMIIEGDDGR